MSVASHTCGRGRRREDGMKILEELGGCHGPANKLLTIPLATRIKHGLDVLDGIIAVDDLFGRGLTTKHHVLENREVCG